MAGKDLNQKLNELISSLQDQGILDDYFDELKGLQDEQSPQFVTNTITIYLGGADDTIAELTKNLSEPAVNYPRVTYLADKLKGSSMRCLALFGGVNREYSILQESLNKIAQLEQAIHDNKD
ncbi:histidine-containing phosphotransfer protein 1 [Rosa chinensis]|uniref:histidine-containing phosphotransfer protein 1 n=1 Tax=Rosa chinensis TaxID=74649 RepID=UPI000D09412D|nr:histidine-containing phosphotransfer protein 1 [Rosa chinensis]